MAGKSCIKRMGIHKINLKAVWRMLLPQPISFMDDKKPDLKEQFDNTRKGPVKELTSLFASEEFRIVMQAFISGNKNPTFMFWKSCMQLVHILLLFTRAQRNEIWDLHLHASQRMLMYFMHYNHVNYAC